MTAPRPILPLVLTGEASALVVGAGRVAARKIRTLLDAGLRPVVLAESMGEDALAIVQKHDLPYIDRAFRPGDTYGYSLVVVATGDREVTRAVADEVRARGGVVACADFPEMGNAHFPAVERRGDVTVAVSTGGASPALAAHLRDRLRAGLPTRVDRDAEALGRARRSRNKTRDWPEIETRLIRRGLIHLIDDLEGPALFERARKFVSGPGPVILVGAGPGDPELATLAAAAALARADVVLYDMLVSPSLLDWAPEDAAREFVGKRGGGEYTPQDEINARLRRHALAGRTVVRLKGGDPFLFGRGSEEWRFLTDHGFAVECVNGVSSAFAALTAAGYALTERERCDSVFVTTGYRSVSPGTRLIPDYDPGLIAIVLMSSKSLPEVLAGFAPKGWPADTPAVVISRATLPDQRTHAATLATLMGDLAAEPLPTPALLAVGNALDRPISEE